MKKNFDSVVVHYDEIGLKGKNRTYFEKLLMGHIKVKLKGQFERMLRESGQITIFLGSADPEKVEDILTGIPGIAYFTFTITSKMDIKSIIKNSVDFIKGEEFSSFKVNAIRRDKANNLKSMEVNCAVGDAVVEKYKKDVKMKNPDLIIKIEISNKFAYISKKDILGVGGIPTTKTQKVVSLLSGGFDSPVASYLMMKRGCEVILVHFMNKTTGSVEGKILSLAKKLSKYQMRTKLYIIPFEKLQNDIIMKVNSKLRMLIYRRFMIRIAERVAKMNRASFLAVGDSLSQVASQTFENLSATYAVSEKHIFSPLIGMDKKEIIDIAKRIGTYDISIQPYGDCCSFFIAKSPELRSTQDQLDSAEKGFDVDSLIDSALKGAKIHNF